MPDTTLFLAWGSFWSLLCLALCAGGLRKNPRRLALAALACGLHECALVLAWPYLAGLAGLSVAAPSPLAHPVDWVPKAAGLLVGLLVCSLGWVTPAEAGLCRPRPGTLRLVAAVVSVVAAALLADAYVTRHAFAPLWWHERVFFASMPGLEEELFYRGVLLGLLSRVFPRTISLLGARTSWGGLVAVLLFALGHSISFPLYWHFVGPHYSWLYYCLSLLHFTAGDLLFQVAMGLLFLWVRERTGSVWVAVAAHCLANTCLVVGHTLS